MKLASTDKVQLVTSAAATVDVTADFMDATTADPPVVKGSTSGPQFTAITTATTTDIVAAPAASTLRNVQNLFIRNKHATTATDVTVLIDRSATDYEQNKTNLLPGEQLEYSDNFGFYKVGQAVDQLQYVRKSSQQTFAATSFADVTGMGFAIAANGVYEIEYDIQWRSATVTVGVGLAINGPTSPTSVQGTVMIIGGTPTTTIGDILSGGFVAYDTPNLFTTSAVSTSVTYGARLSCLIENGGTAGTIIPRWRSETATNTTVEVGSFGTLKRIY